MTEILSQLALTPNAQMFAGGVFLLLLAASVVVYGADALGKLAHAGEIKPRLKTWWWIAILLIGALALTLSTEIVLSLIPLPEAILKGIDERVPARWSRNNPIDLAGGETRDTIPEVLDLITADPGVDALVHLGIGIQHATGNALAEGPFHPDYGLERICAYHERQDRRFAEAGAAASRRDAKPVLVATELVHTDGAYGNSGPLAVKEQGRYCHPSAHRAVRALRAMVDYAEYRARLADRA